MTSPRVKEGPCRRVTRLSPFCSTPVFLSLEIRSSPANHEIEPVVFFSFLFSLSLFLFLFHFLFLFLFLFLYSPPPPPPQLIDCTIIRPAVFPESICLSVTVGSASPFFPLVFFLFLLSFSFSLSLYTRPRLGLHRAHVIVRRGSFFLFFCFFFPSLLSTSSFFGLPRWTNSDFPASTAFPLRDCAMLSV